MNTNMLEQLSHPSLVMVFGRRGSGKTFLATKIASKWPKEIGGKEVGPVVIVDHIACAKGETRPCDYLLDRKSTRLNSSHT